MKRLQWVFATVLVFMSLNTVAQTKTGFDFFKDKWILDADGPTGTVTMVVEFVKNNDVVLASIKDTVGKEMFKVVKTTVKETQAIITFEGSQGKVAMVLDRKDENHLTGDIMGGMVLVWGERVSEKK